MGCNGKLRGDLNILSDVLLSGKLGDIEGGEIVGVNRESLVGELDGGG